MPGIIEAIEFHGQPALRLSTSSGASAVVSLFGAQVLSWIPPGGSERLYLSENARFDGQSPIRGGIPLCFPQFSGLGELPKHGFARIRPWVPSERRCGDDFAITTLRLTEDDDTMAVWPHAFTAELTLAIDGNRLDVELEIENTGHSAFAFTAALHTYLRVAEVEETRLHGLYGCKYRDAADGDRIKRESGEALTIEAQTDRVYHDVQRPLLLREANRSLGINAEGFPDVVVWNPWEDGAKALADMPPLGFRRMLCVEAAAAHHKIALDAGESWWGRQTLITL